MFDSMNDQNYYSELDLNPCDFAIAFPNPDHPDNELEEYITIERAMEILKLAFPFHPNST